MSTVRGQPSGFGIDITELTKRALIALIALYIVELVLVFWFKIDVGRWIFMNRVGGSWMPWQLLTAQLFNHLSPMGAIFDWIILVFFLGPVERLMGRKKLLQSLGIVALGAGFVTTGLDVLGAVNVDAPFVGLNPVITALVVFFGLSLPNATIRLFFVLPIKAAWFAWGSGLVALLYFLAVRDLGSAMALSGWIMAFGVMKFGPDEWKTMWLRYKARNIEKELAKFEILDGGKGGGGGEDDDEYIH